MWRPGRPSASRSTAPSAEAQRRRVPRVRQVRAGQVGAAAEQFGQQPREGLERDLAGLAAGDGLALALRRDRGIDRGLGPAGRQLAAQPARIFGRQLGVGGAVDRELRVPGRLGGLAGGARIPVAVGGFGDHERLVAPAERLARQPRSRRRRAPRRAPSRCRRGSASPCRSSSCRQIKVGRSAPRAAAIAASTASTSWPSTSRITFQR